MKELPEKNSASVSRKGRTIKGICTAAVIAAVLAFAYFSADDVPEKLSVSTASATQSTAGSSFSSAAEEYPEQSTTEPSQTTSTDAPSAVTSSVGTAEDSGTTTQTAAPDPDKDPTPQQSTNAPTTTTVSTSAPETETQAASSVSTSAATSASAITTTAAETAPPEVSDSVTLFISCENAVKPGSGLDDGIRDELPSDGVLFYSDSFEINEGEAVFDVLSRACRENDIPLEAARIAMSSDMYVEGIANLYEFDCGSLSGWMYSVNDDFPQLSISQVTVRSGDVIRILYSCDLGRDVGDNYYS